MKLQELLLNLQELDIRLRVEGDQLRFNAPKGRLTPEVRAALGQHKEQLLILFQAVGEKKDAELIFPASRKKPLPLSFAQQRLWFLEKLEPGNTAYHLPYALRIRGELSVFALQLSFEKLCERHESLRTIFVEVDGVPGQVIAPTIHCQLSLDNLSDLPPDQRHLEVQRIREAEMRYPFDWHQQPPWRARLLRLGEQDHVLLFTIHHILFDGWSGNVFWHDLWHFYNAILQETTPDLPNLPIQYADYALWQHTWLQGGRLAHHLSYWQDHLAGAPALLDLPIDFPRPPLQSYAGALHLHRLPPSLLDRVRALGQQEQATLYMVLLSAFVLLLARSSGQSDVVVGTPIANRTREEFARVLGFFANTLALRVPVEKQHSYRYLLRQVRELALAAYQHQDLPFEHLVEALQPERALDHSPLFQVMFTLQEEQRDWPAESMAGLQVQPLESMSTQAHFDLTLSIQLDKDGLLCGWEYRTDLFASETIEALAQQFTRILTIVSRAPDTPLGQVPLLAPDTRARLLQQWNPTPAPVRQGSVLHWIEQQVHQTPDAIAVLDAHGQLSYEALAAGARRVADALRRNGIGREDLVGVCLQRSTRLLEVLLGIWSVGACYLPLDPSYPPERLQWQIKDGGVRIVVVQPETRATVPEGPWQIWDVQASTPSDEFDTTLANPGPLAHNVAYVLHTSGSTGYPKGVMVEQQQLVNFLQGMQSLLVGQPVSRWAAVTSISFDIAGLELYLPLIQGGCVLLLEREETRDGTQLSMLLERWGATVMQATPATWRLLLASGSGWPEEMVLLCGGEALPTELARQMLQHASAAFWNLYGPTETTIWSTASHVLPEKPITIGSPIRNTTIYLLDAYGEPVPRGVRGEIYIGGVGVARGYLGRAEVTAERFVPDPFAWQPGLRMYRTGDLGRYNRDGLLEYLGREDTQVKVRGYRIELKEIEARMEQVEQVRQAVVVVRAEREAEERLVAYGVLQEGASPQEAQGRVQSWLQQQLPAYMMPAVYVWLEQLPLTPNGKVDRRALPVPAENQILFSSDYVAPRHALEQELAAIWSKELGVEQIRAHDNFFHLGGHSLLATRLVAHIRKNLGVELPLRTLFEAPTLEQLARQVALLQQQPGEQDEVAFIPIKRDGPLHLSFAQQRLWFLEQLDPGTTTYNIPSALCLKGELQVPVLEHCLNFLCQRHESLRTTFEEVGGVPQQNILSELHYRLAVDDFSGLDKETCDEQTRQALLDEANIPFDLRNGPLWRARLLRHDNRTHFLLLTFHHIIFDGWSGDIYVRELLALYTSMVEGRNFSPPPLRVQYADYAHWQRQWLQGETLEKQLAFWRALLIGIVPLNLPLDLPRPAVQTFKGARRSLQLSANLRSRLSDLSQQHGATLYMTLLAAFKVLLARYSDQSDIAIGTPIAGRTHEEVTEIIGCFVNTLVLRSNLAGNPPFNVLLQRVREIALGAYANQDVPFEMLVEEFQRERDQSRSALFQVMFALQDNAPGQIEHPHDLIIEAIEQEQTTAKFDLSLEVIDKGSDMLCVMEYNSDLFLAETIDHMLQCWQTLLQAIVAQPEMNIADLSILAEEEKQTLLVKWNDTDRNYQLDHTFPELFARQVRKSPDRIALIYQDEQFTYRALDDLSDRLAWHLSQRGVRAEALVGLYLERGPAMLIAILAIFKAGGAYVPLDPGYPLERLHFILTNAQISLLLTTTRLQEEVYSVSVEKVYLDTFLSQLEDTRQSWIYSPAVSQNLAYVIYTSGSTGRPKGAMVTHKGLINHLQAEVELLELHQDDIIAQTASHCFDISVWQFLVALLYGGRVCIVEDEIAHDPQLLLGTIISKGLTLVEIVPSLLRAMLDEQERTGLALHTWSLRQLMVTGEALPAHLSQRWFALNTSIWLINAYGPTECSDDVTHAFFTSEDSITGPTAPIGSAIANTQLYILDKQQQPVPIGVPGQIYIGGAGVGRGYLNDPEKTASVFLPNPYSREEGTRLYATGDIGRYLIDGNIEFLGRMDYQVKIRGFRIELGEIEAALAKHPAVRECLVLSLPAPSGDMQLVAYVAFYHEHLSGSKQLKSHLHNVLPSYMVPTCIIELECLPLLPNGKVDIHSLPQPVFPDDKQAFQYGNQGHELETVISDIYCELLSRTRVGRFEDFFEVGGHSLLATQVISRIRTAFQIEIPLRSLFDAPTIAGLTRKVLQYMRQGQNDALMPIPIISREQMLPLSFTQQRLWFLEQLEPGNTTYSIAFGLHLQGILDVQALEASFHALQERHESLRTIFIEVDSVPRQQILPPFPRALNIEDLSLLPRDQRYQQVKHAREAEMSLPFAWNLQSPWRARLLRLNEQEHILLVTIHHIIFDGWSGPLFWRDLWHFYQAYLQGNTSQLPPLTLHYADYAQWQRSWLQGEELDQQLRYWREQLMGAPALLELPADYPRPRLQSHAGALHLHRVPATLLHQLRVLGKREQATLYMVLLSAFALLLTRYSGQQDVVIGTPIANRTREELENLIGFFANTLALRVSCEEEHSYYRLLQQVRDLALGAYRHQDLPFEHLVETLQPERSLDHTPLFQVMFTLQDQGLQLDETIVDLQIQPLEILSIQAHFDLTLSIEVDDDGLLCGWEYRTDLFAPETIEALAQQFTQILHEVERAPQVPLKHISLLSPVAREKLLHQWNPPITPLREGSVLQWIEQQVQRTPDAIAVMDAQGQLSYATLAARARQVACMLRQWGIGNEDLVGVCLQRSTRLLEVLLGIWSVGAGYLPLDPSYPSERLRWQIENARARVIVVQPETRAIIPEGPWTIWEMQTQEPSVSEDTLVIDTKPLAEGVAYVLYTSGSTGRPKGVMVEQRQLANFLQGMSDLLVMQPGSRWAAVTSISFDIAGLELYLPLVHGGCVLLFSPEDARDGERLSAGLERWGATIMQATPITWRLLLASKRNWPQDMELLCGGEALPGELARQMLRQAPGMWNLYGPTETTIWSTASRVQPEEAISIGSPIKNTFIYVLDAHGEPVPRGVYGEIHIGGLGVARGYLGRADLTAERFVPDPFSLEAGQRMYRTGDLGRYRRDGHLEYVGRKDTQVKVRGYRIEPGEIEAQMEQLEEVQQAVVVVREEQEREGKLVAYGVLKEDRSQQEVQRRVQTWLKKQLPAHMVPAVYVWMERLPLTANGKVDRQALPAPAREQGPSSSRYIAPRTMLEYQLQQIWEEVLSIHPVSITESFFALGGHSMLAVQLVSLVKKRLKCPLPLAALFEHATIAQMAVIVRKHLDVNQQIPPLVPLQPQGKKQPFFCVHPAGGTVFCYTTLTQYLGTDQPFYGLQAPEMDANEHSFTSIEEFAICYMNAIQQIQPQGPYLLGGWSLGGIIALEIAQQLRKKGQEVTLLALIESSTDLFSRRTDSFTSGTLDLSAAGLVRAVHHFFPGVDLSRELHHLAVEAQLEHFLEELKQQEVFPQDMDFSLFKQFLYLHIKLDYALSAYKPEAYSGQVVLFRTGESLSEQVAQSTSEIEADTLGWSKFIAERISVYEVPGNHYSLLEQPHVEVLASLLGHLLDLALSYQIRLSSG